MTAVIRSLNWLHRVRCSVFPQKRCIPGHEIRIAGPVNFTPALTIAQTATEQPSFFVPDNLKPDEEPTGKVIDLTQKTPISSLPNPPGYVAKIESVGGNHLCAGVLISPTEVIVLAHCVKDVSAASSSFPTVVLGGAKPGSSSAAYTVCRVDLFSRFDPETCGKNDVAVLELAEAAAETPIGSISSPAGDSATSERLVAFGWFADCAGSCSSCGVPEISLHYIAEIASVDSGRCSELYDGESMINRVCAAPRLSSQCSFDLGAPLVNRDGAGGALVGLAAFLKEPTSGCNMPIVFTHVDRYRWWINSRKRFASQTKTFNNSAC